MSAFTIKVLTTTERFIYVALAESSMDAFMAASDAQGDSLCSITIMPIRES